MGQAAAQTPGVTLTKVYAPTEGSTFGNLIRASDGNFYGSMYGASPGAGSIFKLTPDGTLTTLHQFTGTEGTLPDVLLLASDGNFYGTTTNGGSAGLGTVFRLTPEGVLTTLHEFTGADGVAPGGLFQNRNGDLDGYTADSFTHPATIFRLTPGGKFKILYRFGVDQAALAFIQARDGGLYGTSNAAGIAGFFQLLPDGALTTIHTYPNKGDLFNLLQVSDGDFYGLSLLYDEDDFGPPYGTLARVTPDGRRTDFFLDIGNGIPDSMIQGQDGNFYITGVERFFSDDDPDGGTVVCATPEGYGNPVYVFGSAEPYLAPDYPTSAVVQTSDGSFYGTANGGGGAYLYRLRASFPAATIRAVIPEVAAGSGDNGKAVVELSGPWPFDLNVYYKVKGDAKPGRDFKARLYERIVIPAGQTSAFVKIRPGSHQGQAGTKIVKLRLRPGGAYSLGDSTVAKIVIRAR